MGPQTILGHPGGLFMATKGDPAGLGATEVGPFHPPGSQEEVGGGPLRYLIAK
jgi:hypothetical protein